jgi:hypothetical protein
MNEEALDSAFAALKKGKAVGWDNLSKEIIQMIHSNMFRNAQRLQPIILENNS